MMEDDISRQLKEVSSWARSVFYDIASGKIREPVFEKRIAFHIRSEYYLCFKYDPPGWNSRGNIIAGGIEISDATDYIDFSVYSTPYPIDGKVEERLNNFLKAFDNQTEQIISNMREVLQGFMSAGIKEEDMQRELKYAIAASILKA